MGNIYEITQGDTGQAMLIDLQVDGVAEDVSDATGPLVFRWLKPDGTYSESKAITNLNLVTGSIEIDWTSGDTDVPGTHRAQVMVPRPTGPQSFPSDGSWYRWRVNPKLTAAL